MSCRTGRPCITGWSLWYSCWVPHLMTYGCMKYSPARHCSFSLASYVATGMALTYFSFSFVRAASWTDFDAIKPETLKNAPAWSWGDGSDIATRRRAKSAWRRFGSILCSKKLVGKGHRRKERKKSAENSCRGMLSEKPLARSAFLDEYGFHALK